jgi:hypothetical protein
MLLTSEIKSLGWSDIDTTKNANVQHLITEFGKVGMVFLSLEFEKKSNIFKLIF